MNKIIITFLFLVGITASSCTTSKSVVSQNVDLSTIIFMSFISGWLPEGLQEIPKWM